MPQRINPAPPSSPALRAALAGVLIAAGSWSVGPAGGQDLELRAPEADAKGDGAGGLTFAHALLRNKHYARAAEEYERLLRESPDGPDAAEALFGLGWARLFQRDASGRARYGEARQHFEAFLAQAPEHPRAPTARFRVGELAYLTGDLPAARASLEAFAAANPGHRDLESAWAYLGDVCYLRRDWPAARRAYQQSLRDYPGGRLAAQARYGLGQTLAAEGDWEGALAAFGELAGGRSPEWTDKARLRLGQVLARVGRSAEAVGTFEALERDQSTSPLIPEARLGRAEALLRLGRPDEAEALLGPIAAEAAPTLAPRAAYLLGASHLGRGRPAEALAALDDALDRFPGSPTAPALWFRSAEAAQAAGRPDEARDRYRKVAEVGPDDPWADDALLRAAGLALEAKDPDAAQATADALARSFPQSPLVADAHLIEARAALARGQTKQSIHLIRGLLDQDRPGAETEQAALYVLGQAYRADGQADRAIEVFQALERSPVAADAQFQVGQEHYQAGRFAEATGPLEAYLTEKPEGEVAGHALAYLALARLELGQAEQAGAAFDQLAARFPESPVLAPTRLRLAEAALKANQFDRAEALFGSASEADDLGSKVAALSGLGWARLRAGRPAEAADAFRKRLELRGDDPTAAEDGLALGRALEAAGQVDEALAAYERTATEGPQAGPASLARARLLARAGRPAEAAEALIAHVEAQPAGGGGERDAALLAEAGWDWLDAGKPEEADRAFARILAEFPESPQAGEARLNLAESAYEAGAFDEVERQLAPLVAEGSTADPALIQSALYRLGRTRAGRRDWPGAASAFGRLVAAHPDGPFRREARFWKAEAAFQGGDAATAEAEFAALVDEPTAGEAGPEPWLRTAHLRLVQALVLLGRWPDVLGRSDPLIAEGPPLPSPQRAEVAYARGRAFQGLARFDEARAAYQIAIDLEPGGDLAARAQLMRGETYFHQGRLEEALDEFLRVDVLYRAPAWQAAALLEAGKVDERLARWADAADIYNKLRATYPDDPKSGEAAHRLEEIRARAGSGEGGSSGASP